MSDMSQGPGWWIASDGQWYPPHLHPAVQEPPASGGAGTQVEDGSREAFGTADTGEAITLSGGLGVHDFAVSASTSPGKRLLSWAVIVLRKGGIREGIVGALVVAALLTSVSTFGRATSLASSSGSYWMISKGKIDSLIAGGLTQTQADFFFNNPKTFLETGANGVNPTASEISGAHAAYPNASINLLFNSWSTNTLTGAVGIQGFIANGTLATLKSQFPSITAVQYDPEGTGVSGNGTPAVETAALEAGDMTYAQDVATAVHGAGLKFIFTPSTDVGMVNGEGGYPRKYTTWLAQDRGAWAKTSGADLYSVQSQQIEGIYAPTTPNFDSFVMAAMAQVKASGATIPVDMGLGINPQNPATCTTTQMIADAYNASIAAGVAGFWNNVEMGKNCNVSPSVYAGFFQWLYGITTTTTTTSPTTTTSSTSTTSTTSTSTTTTTSQPNTPTLHLTLNPDGTVTGTWSTP